MEYLDIPITSGYLPQELRSSGHQRVYGTEYSAETECFDVYELSGNKKLLKKIIFGFYGMTAGAYGSGGFGINIYFFDESGILLGESQGPDGFGAVATTHELSIDVTDMSISSKKMFIRIEGLPYANSVTYDNGLKDGYGYCYFGRIEPIQLIYNTL